MKKIGHIFLILCLLIALSIPPNLVFAISDTPNTFPVTSGSVADALEFNGYLYIGGSFSTVSGQSAQNLARIDLASGLLDTNWSPAFGINVFDLEIDATHQLLFAAGNGLTNAYDLSANPPTKYNWLNLSATGGNITDLAVDEVNQVLYLGGAFASIKGATRYKLAAVDYSTPAAPVIHSWDPNVGKSAATTGTVNVLRYDSANSLIYVGGVFNATSHFIGGQQRNRIAALSSTTGAATSWNPNAGNQVYDIQLDLSNGLVYVGGIFTTIGGQTRNRVAALSTSTGLATSWDPNVGSTVYSLFKYNSEILIGGAYTTVNGGATARNNLASVSVSDGTATAFNPNVTSTVNYVYVSNNKLYIGGAFTAVGGNSSIVSLAQFNAIPEPSEQVNISATVDPVISLNLYEVGTTTPTSTCALGTLSTSTIETCGYDVVVSTNASTGYTASIKAISDLVPVSGNGDDINASDGTVTPASEEYGVSTSAAAQTITQTNTTCSALDNGTTAMNASSLTTSDQDVVTSGVPVDAQRTTICHAAAISDITAAGSYSHQVTITAVGSF